MARHFAVLLVEDDPTLGPLTADALRTFGHRITLAPDVQRAFEQLDAANDFDAIVLDLNLGDDAGESLIDLLLDAEIEVPEVVIVSALPLDLLQRVQKRIDACSILQKPCSADDIHKELDRCVAK